MKIIHTHQMADGGWNCFVVIGGVKSNQLSMTPEGAQKKMRQSLIRKGKDLSLFKFDELVWRKYEYSEVMKRNPLVMRDDFVVGQVIRFCPDSIISHPYYAEVISIEKNGKGFIDMTLNVPGHIQRRIFSKGQWEYFLRKVNIIGMKEDHNHLLIGQLLVGVKMAGVK